MSYWVEDGKGEWLGDLGSDASLNRLQDRQDALGEFVRSGVADEEDLPKIIEVCDNESSLGYIADMLRDAEAPVIVTDGE